jgi:hypothetical protein
VAPCSIQFRTSEDVQTFRIPNRLALPEGNQRSLRATVTFGPNACTPGDQLSRAFAVTHASKDAWFHNLIRGVKIWDLMFEPDHARATNITNSFNASSWRAFPHFQPDSRNNRIQTTTHSQRTTE